jgi:hypothetical protein
METHLMDEGPVSLNLPPKSGGKPMNIAVFTIIFVLRQFVNHQKELIIAVTVMGEKWRSSGRYWRITYGKTGADAA